MPPDEGQRLHALRALLILDTPPEERFDRIVRFAADEFDAPIALITLVDQSRQWFKARVGLEVCETGRDISFCGHAINQAGVFTVDDAVQDPRFFDNPLVTGSPFIRFYAGMPLRLPTGEALGTLCVIDTSPRQFDAIDLAILASLATLVTEELAAGSGAA